MVGEGQTMVADLHPTVVAVGRGQGIDPGTPMGEDLGNHTHRTVVAAEDPLGAAWVVVQ